MGKFMISGKKHPIVWVVWYVRQEVITHESLQGDPRLLRAKSINNEQG